MSLGSVFYEDSPGDDVKNYGLHVLALTAVSLRHPEFGLDARQLQRAYLEANPRKADSKLLETVRVSGGTPERPVVAVFDADKLHRLLGLQGGTSLADLEAALRIQIGEAPYLVLIVENTETLLRACCHLMNREMPRAKPTPRERDAVFHATVAQPALVTQLCDEEPAFKKLVETLESAILGMRSARDPGAAP